VPIMATRIFDLPALLPAGAPPGVRG